MSLLVDFDFSFGYAHLEYEIAYEIVESEVLCC